MLISSISSERVANSMTDFNVTVITNNNIYIIYIINIIYMH